MLKHASCLEGIDRMSYLILAFLSMLSFGVYYYLVKVLSLHIPSLVIAFISNAVVLIFIFSYLYLSKLPILPKRRIYIVYSLLISIPVAVGILTLYIAISRGPVSIVMPTIGVNSMIAVLLGIFILREKLTLSKALGVLLALVSVVLLNL